MQKFIKISSHKSTLTARDTESHTILRTRRAYDRRENTISDLERSSWRTARRSFAAYDATASVTVCLRTPAAYVAGRDGGSAPITDQRHGDRRTRDVIVVLTTVVLGPA